MTFKLSFSEYKNLQKKFEKMSQKELSHWMARIYENGFKEGYENCQMQKGKEIDFELLKIAIKATEGVGDVLYKRICETIDNLCFEDVSES